MPKPLSPQINWNNPITKGLVFDVPFFEKGSTAKEIIKKITSLFNNTPTWVLDIFGTCVDLTGASNKQIQLTNNSSFVFGSTMTIFALIKPISFGGSSQGRILDRLSGTTGYAFMVNNAASEAGLRAFFVGTQLLSSNNVINLNVWNFVVVTYDANAGSNQVKFYVNGIPAGVATQTGNIQDSNTDLFIGNSGASTRVFDGRIAALRMWNRSITPQEIKQLYNDPWQIYIRPQQSLLVNTISAIASTVQAGWLKLLGVGK